MNTVWKWIKDRFRSSRTKADFLFLIGIAAGFGLIAGDVVTQVKAAIEAGQSLFADGASIFEMIRFSALQFWSALIAFIGMIGKLRISNKRNAELKEFIFREMKIDASTLFD